MKYLISESKINSTIYNFIDELFTSKDGKSKFKKVRGTDNVGTPLDDSFNFVNVDYQDGEDFYVLFSWTGRGYYRTIYAQGDITELEYVKLLSEAPFLEIFDKNIIVSLDGYFNDLWKPVFKQWFKDKTGLDYKTLSLQ